MTDVFAGLDIDGRMCAQLTELKLQKNSSLEKIFTPCLCLTHTPHTRCLFYVVINLLLSDFCNS